MNNKGLYQKYIINKADGGDVDPDAIYFVLRLDTDEAARKAALLYAVHCDNLQLSRDIFRLVLNLEYAEELPK